MSLQAYQQAASRAESSREAEYRLFAQVTLALMDAAKAEAQDLSSRFDALDWNRQVWTIMAGDCSNPENRLPPQLRASIISLSIWVGKHTSAVLRQQEEIQPLIDVNRIVMQGLAPTAAAA